MIYLDNNATTQPLPEVVSAVANILERCWGNPSSPHILGQMASEQIEIARNQVAALLGSEPAEITFTSGATEANEAVLKHFAICGYDLITSEAEHPSITSFYQTNFPSKIHYIPLDEDGKWELEKLDKLPKVGGGRRDYSPSIIAFSWANGETGVIQNAKRIAVFAQDINAPILVDASQYVGRDSLTLPLEGQAYFTFSGHKVHAPKGVGVLVQFCSNQNKVVSQLGGGQESGFRGGTENVPGIVGLGIACSHCQKNQPKITKHLSLLRDSFEEKLLNRIPEIRINGKEVHRVTNTSNITFKGIDAMALVARLASRNIICSQVSACSSGRPAPSATLLAMGLSENDAHASVRFAFSQDNQLEEVETVVEAVREEVFELRELFG